MSTALTVFVTELESLTQLPTDKVTTADKNAAVQAALSQYSTDKPHDRVADIAGAGSYYVEINTTNLPSWDEGASAISSIEYPAATVASDETPQVLDSDEWGIYETAAAKYIRFKSVKPVSTETIRVSYLTPWTFAGDTLVTDTPASDFYPICQLSAAHLLRAVASKYGSSSSLATFGADSVNWDSKVDQWRRLAKEFEAAYNVAMGKEGRKKAALVIVDTDVPHHDEYLLHGGYNR